MPSPYTAHLRLELQATGENRSTWGVKANNVFSRIEDAIAGTASVAMADANVTLTEVNGNSDQSRNMFVEMTGANTAIRTVTIPSVSKLYFIKNSTTGGFVINVKTAPGTTVTVDPSSWALIICDGTDCFKTLDNAVSTLNGQPASYYLNSTNQNAGTLADARLPTTMVGKTLTGTTVIDGITSTSSAALYRNVTNGGLVMFGGTTGDRANVELFGSTHATVPNQMMLDASTINMRGVSGTGTPAVTIGGNTIGSAAFVNVPVSIADGGTGSTTAANARSALGLGTIATQNSNGVAITGGSITGITDLAVADGGTGASSASAARTNLGLVIGTNVQAWDADLDTLAASTFAPAGKEILFARNSSGSLVQVTIDTGVGSTVMNAQFSSNVANAAGLGTSDTVTFGEVRSADDVSYSGYGGSSPDYGASTATQGYYLTGSGLLSLSRSGAQVCQMQRITSNGTMISFYRNTAIVGSIDVTTTATTYNTSSDVGLKQDFKPINPALLDFIKVYDFEWKVDGTRGYGVKAQELYDVLPQAVSKGETEEDMWSVDYSKIVPLLVAKIQSLEERIKAFEGKA